MRDRFQNLKLSMFTDPASPRTSFPKLKGRATEIRHLGPSLLRLWSEKMDQNSATHKQVRLALKASCAFEEVLGAHKTSVRLPASAVAEVQAATRSFLLCLTALATHHQAAGAKLFNVTIKCHYLAHAGDMASGLNPRLGWCYLGEDYMSKLKRLVASCLRGTPAPQVATKVLRKYLVAMHLRMAGLDAIRR